MFRTFLILVAAAAIGIPAAESGTAPGVAAETSPIGLAELPQPARDALLREAQGREIGPITRTVVDGRIVYETDLAADAPRLLRVSADGDVQRDDEPPTAGGAWDSTKKAAGEAWGATKNATGEAWDATRAMMDRDGVTLETVPGAVRRTLLGLAAAERIVDIDIEAKAGRAAYVAEIRVPDARNRTVVVSGEGELLSDTAER